ncbi:hypothetical protein Bealeia1_00048 [Candidatus Bealeia paramacronuclearis]|uniref:Uncharacterized protein n=2 Tax=Candidatus Bealeia paramacronuclearis TaxID=1921001 RepID=A0ABZ2C362_9PROT|nr:hypothetical protein [Candidatus Bealeia paramacronuclearis]
MVFKKRSRGRHPYRILCDLGTPELRQKRQAVSNQDANLSESLLGIFYARGLISEELYKAGFHYYELGYRYIPQLRLGLSLRRSLLAGLGEGTTQGAVAFEDNRDFPQDVKVAKKWKEATQVLKDVGVRPLVLVTHVVFFDGDPRAVGAPGLTLANLSDLRVGLVQLAKFFNFSR